MPKSGKIRDSKPVVVASLGSSINWAGSATTGKEKSPPVSEAASRGKTGTTSSGATHKTKPLRKQKTKLVANLAEATSLTTTRTRLRIRNDRSNRIVRSKGRKRRSSLVVLAGAKTRGTIGMGKLKLRRSMWILR